MVGGGLDVRLATEADQCHPYLAGTTAPTAEDAPINHDAYVTVTTAKELDVWIKRASEAGLVCVDTETTSLDAMQAAIPRSARAARNQSAS